MPSCEHVKNALLLNMSREVQYEAIALEDQAFVAPVYKTLVATFHLSTEESPYRPDPAERSLGLLCTSIWLDGSN